MSRDCFISIGAGKHQTGLIRQATTMGLRCLAVDIDPAAEGFDFAGEHLVHSAHDFTGLPLLLEKQCAGKKIRGVGTQAARGCIKTTAVVAEHFGLPGVSPDVAGMLDSKEAMLSRFNGDFLPAVYTDTACWPKSPSYPMVLKVEGKSGGEGVRRIFSDRDFAEARQEFRHEKKVLFEPAIKGRHLGIIGMAYRGRYVFYGIAERLLDDGGRLDRIIFPADLFRDEVELLAEYAREVLGEAGVDFGPFQLEVILLDDDQVYFVEIEASMLGSYLTEYMIPLTSGNNFLRDAIELACGDGFNEVLAENAYVCVSRYFYPQSGGRLVGYELCNWRRGILFLPYVTPGEIFSGPNNYGANAITCARSQEEAEVRLDGVDIRMEVEGETGKG